MATMIEKDSADLIAKVAAMSVDLRIDRILEIADSHDTSDEAAPEAVKLLFGPEATLGES
jgi:hypothetical protein